MTYFLNISQRLPGLNDYTKACRTNKYQGAKMKKDTEEMICYCILTQRLPRHLERAKLKFTWLEPNEKRDPDNIAFAKKFLLDSLVKMEVLNGDRQKNIAGLIDEFEKGNGVKVEIEEII